MFARTTPVRNGHPGIKNQFSKNGCCAHPNRWQFLSLVMLWGRSLTCQGSFRQVGNLPHETETLPNRSSRRAGMGRTFDVPWDRFRNLSDRCIHLLACPDMAGPPGDLVGIAVGLSNGSSTGRWTATSEGRRSPAADTTAEFPARRDLRCKG